ncbi:MAG: GtrA family protein [Hyphomicrobium sp.]|uniref:GtrA family protein n=1 Tax=Hyphomicrobium sp. TaxID=82 RepID=UPI0039E25713
MHPNVRHALLYTSVNLSATIVDTAIFLTLTHIFGLPIVQSVIAYSTATIVNFWLTRNFVFRHDMSHKTEHRLFLEFVAVAVLGLAITAFVIWLTVHEMHLLPIEGKVISILVCFVSLYWVRSRVVFSKNARAATADQDFNEATGRQI